MIGPVQRDCICDPWMRRHGEHGPECAKAYKAKLLGRVDDVRALHAEGHPLTPECPTCPHCEGGGTVMVAVGPIDRLSGQPDGTVEVPCSCEAGDRQAVWRGHFDVLSRAALAPAPVSREDYLNTLVEDALTDENPDFPNPPSQLSGQARNRAGRLSCDAATDAEGRPVAAIDLSAGQARTPAGRRSERDANPVAAVPAVPGPGTDPSPSLVPARSLPGAQATMTSEDPASAPPGRRSTLEGRDAA